MTTPITLTRPAVLLVLLSVHAMLASCSMHADFKAACPYSDFCTVNRSLEITPTSSSGSCCQGCFCDAKCGLFGDCCPDYAGDRLNRGAVQQLDCKKLVVENEYYFEAGIGLEYLQYYRIIDFCPADRKNEKCPGDFNPAPDFDDIAVVSDRKTGTSYKNKYCAQCHGVSDIVRWELVIADCQDPLNKVQLLLSEVDLHLYLNCLIIPVPGKHVPITGRSMQCNFDTECPENEADMDIVEGCIDGQNMPFGYVSTNGGNPTLYKNVMCYQCMTGLDAPTTCQQGIEGEIRTGPHSSVGVLLKPDKRVHENSDVVEESPCNYPETINPFTNKCRRLRCPPFEALSNGKCVKIGSPTGIQLRLLYVPTGDHNNSQSMLPAYNKTMREHYIDTINTNLGNINCKVTMINADVFFDNAVEAIAYMLVDIAYIIDDGCTMDYVQDMIYKRSPFTHKWYTDDGLYISMKGKITFFEFPQFDYRDTSFSVTSLIAHMEVSHPYILLHSFFLCPYYTIDFDEYARYVTRTGGRQTNASITTVTAFMDTLHGFYPLSTTEIGACLQTYTNAQSSGGAQIVSVAWLLSLVCLLVF